MSILIKGLEMPTDRSRWVVIYPDGKVEYSDKTDKWETLDKGAVPVPAHGRLIDADVLAEKHRELAYELRGANYDFHMTAKSWVDNAPTIIPAEEGET